MLCREEEKKYSVDKMLPLLKDMKGLKQEHFVVITLSNDRQVIKKHTVFIGTVNASIVHPREVFARALEDNAVSIIVAHNHPSGDPTPSRQDKEVTRQLAVAGVILAVRLHDHIVVAVNGYYSFRESGVI